MANELTEDEKKIVEQARAKHGVVCAFKPGGRLVVFRRCTIGERDRVKVESGTEDKRAIVDKNLAISCLVHPENVVEGMSILDEFPFVYDKAGARIVQMSGADVEEVGKV